MKSLTIHVPDSYELPSFFTKATPEERALALTIGAESFQLISKKARDDLESKTYKDIYTKLLDEHKLHIEELQASATVELKRLQGEKGKHEEALRAASLRIQAMETSAQDIRTQAQRDAKELSQERIKDKEEQITRLQGMLEKQMETMTARVEGLQNSITRTFSSSKEKGSFGEWWLEGFIKKAFDCSVEVISKDAQTADIRMTRDASNIYFWEVKNYTRMVSAEEIEKLKRDLRLHPEIRGGILVSLRTGIVGKSRGGEIDMEFMEDGRAILYLSNLMSREDVVFYLQSLRPYFETLETLSKPAKDDSETVRLLNSKAALVTNLLRSHAQNVTKHRNSIVTHKKRIDSMFSEFQAYIMEAEMQLQSLLKLAVGSDDDQTTIQGEVDTHLPVTVFTKESLSDCDEKMKTFMKWLLSVATVTPGVQIEIKDLIERGKKAEFSEKYIRSAREEVFQDAAWPKGSRYILGLTWKEREG